MKMNRWIKKQTKMWRIRYAANKRVWQIALCCLVSSIVLRWPFLVEWVPKESRDKIMELAYLITNNAFYAVLFFVKGIGTSGDGSAENPYYVNNKEVDVPVK